METLAEANRQSNVLAAEAQAETMRMKAEAEAKAIMVGLIIKNKTYFVM